MVDLNLFPKRVGNAQRTLVTVVYGEPGNVEFWRCESASVDANTRQLRLKNAACSYQVRLDDPANLIVTEEANIQLGALVLWTKDTDNGA